MSRSGGVAVATCVLVLMACSRLSAPSERQAEKELQGYLDRIDFGVWRVNGVRQTNGRFTKRGGVGAYVMDAEVDITIIKSMRSEDFFPRSAKMVMDLWSGRTWRLNLLGRSGERKLIALQLLWMERDKTWTFLGPCNDCST